MIDHAHARRLAAEAIDFAIGPDDRAALDTHLATCDACRSVAERLASDALALAMLPPLDGPDELRASVLRGVVSGEDGQRRDRKPFFRPRSVVALTAMAMAVVIVAGTLIWSTGQHPGDPGLAIGTAGPNGATPGNAVPSGNAPTPGPGMTGEPTQDRHPVAMLAASQDQDGIVPLDVAFRLTSLDGTPVADLATRVSVDPPLALAVVADPDGASVSLKPAEPLLPGVVYRFTLADPAGATLGSWAFQASQPIRVVSTLPEDQATEVPLNTGIEVTFDQDGVTDAASHVTIEPAVKGTFQEHGRVLVFVPEKLAPATVYTVTVRRGVGIPGTGEELQRDVRFQFETRAAGGAPQNEDTTFEFTTPLFEAATADRPVLSGWASSDEGSGPASQRVEVYRLPDMTAGIAAFVRIRNAPSWSRWSTAGVVGTDGLQRVVAMDAELQGDGPPWFRLPLALAPGWYLVQHPADPRPSQAVLQVTDVSAYLATTTTRSLVWANDVAAGGALSGATVSVSGGEVIGHTDADGLLVATTPAAVAVQGAEAGSDTAASPIVTVTATDGRAAFLPTDSPPSDAYDYGVDVGYGTGGDDRYWSLLHTDRLLYRSTDTVNAWGMVRLRASGSVPPRAELRLVATDDGETGAPPPVAIISLEPDEAGVISGSVALKDAAGGGYGLQLWVEDQLIATTDLQVGTIAKPAYRLELETGHRVYVEGDRIKATVRATFFEGTPVAGVRLHLMIANGRQRTSTTDRAGVTAVRGVAATEEESSWEAYAASASSARPEEGDISGVSPLFLVFPSARMVEAEGQIVGGRVAIDGSVHAVDVERLERELDAGASVYDVEPRGKAAAGVTVTARFIEQIPVRVAVGTEYDFIAKEVVTVYEDNIVDRDAGTVKVKSGADGAFSVAIPSHDDHDYRVELSVRDREGHRATTTAFATTTTPGGSEEEMDRASLVPTDPSRQDQDDYALGQSIDLTLRSEPTGDANDRHLFYVAREGLRDATVQSSARFTMTFGAEEIPNVEIVGVRFTGSGYLVSGAYDAVFRQDDRKLHVDVSVRAPRYAPGDTATLDVQTRSASGRPVAATVVLRAVDEKLFAIGAASDVDTLSELYQTLSSGIVSTYATHAPPRMEDGGGDTGGGGDDGARSDFVDSLLFRKVKTDAQGHAVVSFELSDDLTSWHVSASGVSAALEAGDGGALVAVGLPFFVDASIAPEYLTADRPAIRLTAYGSDLAPDARVTFTVESTDLGFRSPTISARAFHDVAVALPELTPGVHTLTISASSGSGTSAMHDRLIRTFKVVDSRLTRTKTTYAELGAADVRAGGAGLTSYVISDAGRGRYLPLLFDLAGETGVRLDQALSAELARSALISVFRVEAATLPASGVVGQRYQKPGGGVSLLPYGGVDLQLTSMVAIVAPDRFDRVGLASYLSDVLADPKSTRERRAYALAGLAGLGRPVLRDIRARAEATDLTIRERLILGLGAAALGDGATARSIERALADEYLESLGEQARLRVGSTPDDMTTASAMMAVLAAWNGSAIAPALWDYVTANAAEDEFLGLHGVAFATRMLARSSAKPARFAYAVAGKREVIDLAQGDAFSLTLSAAQRATLAFEALSGDIGVASTWQEPTKATSFTTDPDVSIRREVKPSGKIDTGDLVRVDLMVTFGPRAASGCRQVTDLVPSGLFAVGILADWPGARDEDEAPSPPAGVTSPYEQAGQRVSFCAEPTTKRRTVDLRYYTRVVTPGTYRWEPAIVQASGASDRASLTSGRTVTVR